MEQMNRQIQAREAYRFVVRQAALDELEKDHLNSQQSWWRRCLGAASFSCSLPERASAEDLALAHQYCEFLEMKFAAKFKTDTAIEVARLRLSAVAMRSGAQVESALQTVRAVSWRSWLIGFALFLPLASFMIWALTHMVKLTSLTESAGASLACMVLLAVVSLPAVLFIDDSLRKKRQAQLREP
jgi:hypothetical protein